MLENALLYDAHGQPLLRGKLNSSREWSEVSAFCNTVYRHSYLNSGASISCENRP